MEKLLSIVIPTYNMEKYLHKCLNSLIVTDGELLKKVDVLIVNDGSKDNSLLIAREYEARHPETFRVIDKPNGNYGSCINTALPLALGKYIKILDADDSFNTINFQKILMAIESIDVDMLITDYEIVNEIGTVTDNKRYDFPQNQEFDMLDYLPDQAIFQMHAVAYKTQNLRDIHYRQTEHASYTDVEWVFSPIITVKTAYYLPVIIYEYLVGRSGQTVAGDTVHKKFTERFTILKNSIGIYRSLPTSNMNKNTVDYIERHIKFQIHGLYYTLLIVNRDKHGALKLDKLLKDNIPVFYKNSIKYDLNPRIKYKFIKHWRQKGSLPPAFIYRLLLYLKKLFR